MTIDILVGGTYRTNKHGLVTVLEIENSKKVLVKFHNTRYEKFVTSGNLRKGNVLDDSLNYYASGAIMDLQGKFNNQRSKEYSLWQGMLTRCYSEALHERRPRYKDCEVSNFFKLFSNFKEWCATQVGFNVEGFDLDKDLLIKNNKIYSEHTCTFLPKEINIALEKCNQLRGDFPIGVSFSTDRNKFLASFKVNGKSKNLGRYDTANEAFLAYKEAKEVYLKDLANKWKEHIDPRAYDALMNYEVSIDD